MLFHFVFSESTLKIFIIQSILKWLTLDLGKVITFTENYNDLMILVKRSLTNIPHVIRIALLLVFDQSVVPLSYIEVEL